MKNIEIANVFAELADLLEIQGANAFRIRAYRTAASTIEGLSESVVSLLEKGADLQELPGIGKDLAAKMQTIVESGELPQLEQLREELPPGLLEIMRLPGVGPKKTKVLFKELSVTSITDLQAAAEAGRIAELKGFGKKSEQAILDGIARAAQIEKRFLRSHAEKLVEQILDDLLALKSVSKAEAAGSYRRLKETVGDLDVLAIADDPTEAMDLIREHRLVLTELARGKTKQRVRLQGGLEMDLRVVPEASYGAALQYFTGSKEHNIAVRKRAVERGLSINEYGVHRDDDIIAGATEQEVYSAVDLPWIPPELRENRGEIEAAEDDRLPRLIALDDLRGDLHMHTTATDGQASIEEMASAAKERGLEYIAITDHSKRVAMANGLDADRLRDHWVAIDKVRSRVSGIHILRGIECDILEDATLDLPDDVLDEADWVIAVLHYGLQQPRQTIMKRLLHAVAHPAVNIIGHPSGRLIGERLPADIDYDELFAACVEHGTMLEINASPHRLDLDDVQAAAAKRQGIRIVISTDAHSTKGLDAMRYGVAQARRAWLTADDVANALTWSEFEELIRR